MTNLEPENVDDPELTALCVDLGAAPVDIGQGRDTAHTPPRPTLPDVP